MRRRGMNEAGGPERVDEPVNRIPVHGIAVDGARRYHSGQRYPPRLYLVRGGDRGGVRGHRMAARNRATTVHGTSPVLRHNWNSMTATTTERTRERAHGDGYTSMTRDEFKTRVGRRSTTSVRSDPLRFFLAPRRDIDLFFDRINASFVDEIENYLEWIFGKSVEDFDYPLTRIINNEIRKLVEECSGPASVYHDYRASFRENN